MFGGQSNLLQAIDNIFTVYEPQVVAVHTTCLSETIGDDMPQIIDKAVKEGKIPAGRHVIYANTPSYVGSHVTGFSNMVKGMVRVSESTGHKNGKVNIIPGWVEPADMEEIKRLSGLIGVEVILFPDTSGILNGPLSGEFKLFPEGGGDHRPVKIRGNSIGTLALGEWCSADAARYLDTNNKVPCRVLDIPVGLKATDRFVDALRTIAGVSVPEEVTHERGQLVDMISDMHQYFYHKKTALAGDPDQLIAMTEFLVSIDMCRLTWSPARPARHLRKRSRN